MEFEEKTIKQNVIYNGRILSLRKDDILLPDGNQSIREIIDHHGGSAVYCEKDGKILLVRQFRYAYKEEVWEIPAGKINEGEAPMETALREIEEEGGVKAEKLTLICEMYPSPGYTNEKVYIYKAEGITEGKKHLDEDEFLSSCWMEKEKVLDMIHKGEIKDAKTLIALFSQLKNV